MGQGTATPPKTRRRRIIERPRLTRLLDASQGRIKMLVAPAGYGKTTLARQWLADKQAVWYTATPASADVAALAAELRDTVLGVNPRAGAALIERLPVTRSASDEARLLAGMLSADLATWPAATWLVIDDYHELSGSPPAEDFVESLIVDAPLNVLLLTRQRPKWASSRRILYGEIFEMDRSLLAMIDAEAAALVGLRSGETSELFASRRVGPPFSHSQPCSRNRRRIVWGLRPVFTHSSPTRFIGVWTGRQGGGSRSWRCTASKDGRLLCNRCRSTMLNVSLTPGPLAAFSPNATTAG